MVRCVDHQRPTVAMAVLGVGHPAPRVSWLAGGIVLLFVILRGVQRLLFEWQRRKTLIELLKHASPGSEIIHVDGARGARMKVTVGASPDQAPGLPGDRA